MKKKKKKRPSQSKMKVSTESMRSSAFWRGCAVARVVKVLIILEILEVLLFRVMLGKLDEEAAYERLLCN